MQLKLGEIASQLGGRVEGDPDVLITGVAGLREAIAGHISFLANPKYACEVPTTRATAVIVPRSYSGTATAALVRVDDPYAGFVHVLKQYSAGRQREPEGIHARACVDPGAHLGAAVGVGAAAVIEAGARIGAGTTVGAGAYVGRDVVVGEGCLLHPGVRLLHGVQLGSRVIVHAGTVVGSDGFGFVPTRNGHDKIPQIGDVVIEDDVEIGANCAIDRGTLGSTRIGRGVKIDNLVHVGHNVIIGENSVIVAQVGISGSTRLGRGVTLGGQVGVAGHVEVGDGARVGGQSGVTKSVEAGAVVSGYPAMDHVRARRLQAHLRRLPDLSEQVRKLEARLRDLEKGRE